MTDKEKRRMLEKINAIKFSLCSATEQLNSMIENMEKFTKEKADKVYVVYNYSELSKEPEIIGVFRNQQSAVNFVKYKYSDYWVKEMEVNNG